MRGHNPIGWAATLLVAVAYAHVLLELAAAVLAMAIAGRVAFSPAPGLIATRLAREVRQWRERRQLTQRGSASGRSGG